MIECEHERGQKTHEVSEEDEVVCLDCGIAVTRWRVDGAWTKWRIDLSDCDLHHNIQADDGGNLEAKFLGDCDQPDPRNL